MAHPLISCIVYGTQNDNYHNQLRGGVRGKNEDVFHGSRSVVFCIIISKQCQACFTEPSKYRGSKIDCGFNNDWQHHDIKKTKTDDLIEGKEQKLVDNRV